MNSLEKIYSGCCQVVGSKIGPDILNINCILMVERMFSTQTSVGFRKCLPGFECWLCYILLCESEKSFCFSVLWLPHLIN